MSNINLLSCSFVRRMLQIKVNKQMKCYYIIIYGHVFMCMYVCMCKREKHREIERERESDRDCRVR